MGYIGGEGSPPRMRGKRHNRSAQAGACGITPADAGKTVTRAGDTTGETDHPRGCGENAFGRKVDFALAGSPPRMRGKLRGSLYRFLYSGITPADAGKTPSIRHPAGGGRDHPRGCGENAATHGRTPARSGSPPRMRGKHTFKNLQVNAGRITPADAGKTLKRSFRNQPFCS